MSGATETTPVDRFIVTFGLADGVTIVAVISATTTATPFKVSLAKAESADGAPVRPLMAVALSSLATTDGE